MCVSHVLASLKYRVNPFWSYIQTHMRAHSFRLFSLGGARQSQMTWKCFCGAWFPVQVSGKHCLTTGCLNLKLVQSEGYVCVRACVCKAAGGAHTPGYVSMHAFQKGYLKASGALKFHNGSVPH